MKKLILVLFLSIAGFGCIKDEITIPEYKKQVITHSVEVVWDDFRKDILDLASRAGITLNHIWHPGSWSTDSYFLNIPRTHVIYNNSMIDSVQYERVNPNFANIGVNVSNYDITIFYKDGFVELLENYICPINYGNTFTQYICPNIINRPGTMNIHSVTMVRSDSISNENLPYRGFQPVKLIWWNIYRTVNGSSTSQGIYKLFPESYKTIQYQPKHII